MKETYKKFLDMENPLLDRFRRLAPGSFKHSQNVSNMCESIALELELDTDLLKLAGLYHDIGKMNFPLHFSENQSAKENIHDSLEPPISCHLITRHVADGVLALFQNDFPSEAIKIISEHHGDTILRQFHKKDAEAPEDNYRYKCQKPSSTESVILMLVDSVEATSRAMFLKKEDDEEPSDFIHRVVQSTVDRLDDDDQLDKIMHGTIKQMKRILVKELESTYHKRISYTNNDESDDKEASRNKV